jgi:hypothetical protein
MAHGLWWLDVTLSVACGLLVPFLMFTQQDHSAEKMTAVWLLSVHGDGGGCCGESRFAHSAPLAFGGFACADPPRFGRSPSP